MAQDDGHTNAPPPDAHHEAQQQHEREQEARGRRRRNRVILLMAYALLLFVLQGIVWTMEAVKGRYERMVLLREQIEQLEALKVSESRSDTEWIDDLLEDARHELNGLKKELQFQEIEDSKAGATQGQSQDDYANKDDGSDTELPKRTSLHSIPAQQEDLHLYQRRKLASTGTNPVTAAAAFWDQAVSFLSMTEWDPITASTHEGIVLNPSKFAEYYIDPQHSEHPDKSAMSSAAALATLGVHALQRAADLGHPEAQYAVANAHAAGFWPTSEQPSTTNSSFSSVQRLHVEDSFLESNAQQTAAWLYWHMAAMSGHAEAAMAMVNRLELRQQRQQPLLSQNQPSQQDTCWNRLPYYEAAANAVIDQLEADPQSRAKIAPASDKHLLYKIHLHGGEESRLEHYNKPDETADALQFYHVRATSDAGGEGKSPQAAVQLASMYHYGLKGVVQNATMALLYYEMAALQNHWEAAGLAGMFYLLGIGAPQDAHRAYTLAQIGMPYGLEGCTSRQQVQRGKKTPAAENFLCEPKCMNVMGLLTLWGLGKVVERDEDDAEQLFQLAKEQGNADAMYNLAMMRLGWKTHFRPKDSTEEDEEEKADSNDTSEKTNSGRKTWLTSTGLDKFNPTLSEFQSILGDLSAAASKSHVQARHRLALMFSKGYSHINKPEDRASASATYAFSKDCERSLKHFKWIIENASPQRASRLRKAYKQYMAGETTNSVRNYLAAAEGGSDVGTLNAAFLLERGECMGMNRIDCAKASSRLWKVAADKGHTEASLRVGDFYYYGKFREVKRGQSHAQAGIVGPFGWVQYLIFPEKFLVPAILHLTKKLVSHTWSPLSAGTTTRAEGRTRTSADSAFDGDSDAVCQRGNTEPNESCPADYSDTDSPQSPSSPQDEHSLENDLVMAAHYYRMAAERGSPRGHFNLGFMFEWGLGPKQDFPLAKRHYDLAVSSGSQEAEWPVKIALQALQLHESCIKRWIAGQEWWQSTTTRPDEEALESDTENAVEKIADKPDGNKEGHESKGTRPKLTKKDVIVSHIFSWESLLILVFTVVLWVLLSRFQTRRQ